MEIAKEAAQAKKKVSFQCPKCTLPLRGRDPDAHGAVNALKFMHDCGMTQAQRRGRSVPNVNSLRTDAEASRGSSQSTALYWQGSAGARGVTGMLRCFRAYKHRVAAGFCEGEGWVHRQGVYRKPEWRAGSQEDPPVHHGYSLNGSVVSSASNRSSEGFLMVLTTMDARESPSYFIFTGTKRFRSQLRPMRPWLSSRRREQIDDALQIGEAAEVPLCATS